MRERGAGNRNQDKRGGGCRGVDEREQVQRSVGREIQDHDPGAGDEMSVTLVPAAGDAKAGGDHRHACQHADRAPRCRSDPRLFERVFQKERDAEEKHEQPGVQHPLFAENCLEVGRRRRVSDARATAAGPAATSGARRGGGGGWTDRSSGCCRSRAGVSTGAGAAPMSATVRVAS